MNVRTFPIPDGMRVGRSGWCKWCGGAVKKPAIYWHPACVDEYKSYTDPAFQHDLLFRRDGPCCRICGAGGYAPGGEHVPKRPGMGWDDWFKLQRDPEALGRQTSLRPRIALEVEHIIPLWSVAHLPDDERRQYFGPSNLQLVCRDCHKAKTRREAAERALRKRAA